MRFWRKAGIFLLALIGLEIVLRLIGFGEVPRYETSKIYEYQVKPNQEVHRFGNEFTTNAYGMRSPQIKKNFTHILKFGDSVLNGGAGTDQSELASSLLQEALSKKYDSLQVLNISAGSWGPDNAFLWMKTHGDFNAKIIVLLFSSHDWSDHMTFRNVVSNTPFYPAHNPKIAIFDALSWVYSRYFGKVEWDELPILPSVDPNLFDYKSGWVDFITYADSANIALLVYHHANKAEFSNGEWNEKGKELEAFLNQRNVLTISGLNSGFVAADYRDEIHPNAEGQAKIERAIEPEILKILARRKHE